MRGQAEPAMDHLVSFSSRFPDFPNASGFLWIDS
jgi:hypothetical protein